MNTKLTLNFNSLGKYSGPTIGALFAILVVSLLFLYVRKDLSSDARLRFDRQTNDAKLIIEARLQSYINATLGLRALFSARQIPTRAEFHRYVASLDLRRAFPGFEVLNFSKYVRGPEKEAFEIEVRNDKSLAPDGYPRFFIKPPGERPDYEVLVYLEPMASNEFAFGLDISVTPAQRSAQVRARDSGQLVTSGRLVSIGENRFVGLSMRMPVYRVDRQIETVEQRQNAFLGTVGAGYNVRNLMAGVLDETTIKSIRYRLYDVGISGMRPASSTRPTLLYDSIQGTDGIPDDKDDLPIGDSFFNAVLPVNFGGRDWELHFSAPKSAFMERADIQLPWIVLLGGTLLSTLLFAVLYAFSSSRERAIALAQIITKELRESEANLARAMEQHRSDAEQIRDLLRRLVTVQEAERRGLSANLHDIVGQSLSVLGMGLQSIRGMLPGAAPKQLESTFADMNRLLKDTMGSVRAVISDLRPPLLDDYGLYAAIEWHARQLESSTGLRVKVEGSALDPRPAPEVELALFRIAQEALVNVAKHAAANEARIFISGHGNVARLVVEDDGQGVGRSKAANDPDVTSGWGMAVMRERAAAVGGAMRVEHPGQGTRVVVEVGDDPNRIA